MVPIILYYYHYNMLYNIMRFLLYCIIYILLLLLCKQVQLTSFSKCTSELLEH